MIDFEKQPSYQDYQTILQWKKDSYGDHWEHVAKVAGLSLQGPMPDALSWMTMNEANDLRGQLIFEFIFSACGRESKTSGSHLNKERTDEMGMDIDIYQPGFPYNAVRGTQPPAPELPRSHKRCLAVLQLARELMLGPGDWAAEEALTEAQRYFDSAERMIAEAGEDG